MNREQSLTVGDSYEKIERFISERWLLYDFDYHRSRFQAGFDANADTYDLDLSNVVIDIYVDSDGRFVKAEVERVYTLALYGFQTDRRGRRSVAL